MIEIYLPGLPRGKGTARSSGRGGQHVYSEAKTVSYEGALRFAAERAMAGREPISACIGIRVVAHLAVPRSWSIRKTAGALNGKIRPGVKPDYDNIEKTLDALKGVVFRDDSQVVDWEGHKYYGSKPGVRINVWVADEEQPDGFLWIPA